jgi:hypothetical protein
MGRFEVPGFAAGTEAVARAMGRATAAGSTTIVGGKDDVLCFFIVYNVILCTLYCLGFEDTL